MDCIVVERYTPMKNNQKHSLKKMLKNTYLCADFCDDKSL